MEQEEVMHLEQEESSLRIEELLTTSHDVLICELEGGEQVVLKRATERRRGTLYIYPRGPVLAPPPPESSGRWLPLWKERHRRP